MLQRPRTALLGALTCLVALVACGVASHMIPAVEQLDSDGLDAFTRVRAHDVDGLLDRIVHLGDPLAFLLMGAAVVMAALARERRRLAAVVAGLLIAAPLSAELLKLATAQARVHSTEFANHISNASWPSGHTTGAMTLALCAVLVAPGRLRLAVALAGGLYALAIGYSVIALVWHFPSDTVGAFLLSGMWVLLGVAALRRWPEALPEPTEARRRAGSGLVVGVLVIMSAGALTVFRPGPVLSRAVDHPELLAGAASIAGLAAALAAAVVLTARSS